MGYASWGQRVGAYLIDSLIASIPAMIGGCLAGATMGDDGSLGIGLIFYLLGAIVSFCLTLYNRWILGGGTGQSWGRKALSIRLVSEQTGQPIGAGAAFLRDLCHFLDTLICYIGWLFPLWDAKSQTLADKIMSTIVVTGGPQDYQQGYPQGNPQGYQQGYQQNY